MNSFFVRIKALFVNTSLLFMVLKFRFLREILVALWPGKCRCLVLFATQDPSKLFGVLSVYLISFRNKL